MAAPALLALLALTCARAELTNQYDELKPFFFHRVAAAPVEAEAADCMYLGRRHTAGAAVRVRDACLRCRCARGQLACARAACAPAPSPPPPRCALLHRRHACCPELHCPDGVKSLELEASARLEEEPWDAAPPAAAGHACAEEGGVFAAGSALGARAACETCFCLRGARRCVRPRCLPPPPGCAPRPAPGVCCPERYYCTAANDTAAVQELSTTAAPRLHDCLVAGEWKREGEAVGGAGGACEACFCLRGAVRCQPLHCAPALHGCRPLLRPGHCCPHQYHCPHKNDFMVTDIQAISDNTLALHSEERSLRSPAPVVPAAAGKVKRGTTDAPPSPPPPAAPPAAPTAAPTAQPEGSVRVVVNGTVNCSAELSSVLANSTASDVTRPVLREPTPREPTTQLPAAAHTEPTEIITHHYEEGDSFVVNVTSSLVTNSSRASAPAPASPAAAPAPATAASAPTPATDPVDLALAAAKNTKDDYDYDYTEPTLPPSLPNLKIIPFVAADAVVDEAEPPKEETFPLLEREDKFPVYYPPTAAGAVAGAGAQRREDAPFPPPAPRPGPAPAPPVARTTAAPTLTTPEVNLFSPPAKTEGGFIPKGPGLIDEYYAVYPSTPPPAPLLTTSMQINPATPDNMDCTTSDGRRVAAGESAWVACSACTCAWGELACSARRCPAPPPRCRRRAPAPAAADPCCGEILCDHDDESTSTPAQTMSETGDAPNVTKVPEVARETERIPFEPPPDRSEPPPDRSEPPPAAAPDHTTSRYTTTADYRNNSIEHTMNIYESINKNNQSKAATEAGKPASTAKPWSLPSTPTPAPASSPAPAPAPEDEEEDDDDGFSFGSVLKLLLSDHYDTTPAPTPAPSTAPPPPPPRTAPPTTRRPPPPALAGSVPTFIPMQPHAYIPPKQPQNTLNRIDHLVLGESTAIKKPTPRPPATAPRPAPTRRFPPRTTTRKAVVTFKTTTKPTPPQEEATERTTPAAPVHAQPAGAGAGSGAAGGAGAGAGGGAGLLKLAGCNIYGRMYRVGRIIAELSSPCQECRCTELGVQCAPLRC